MAIKELDEVRKVDPDPEIPRLQAKYLASAGLFDAAIRTLTSVDYATLPRLRRWLVDDRSIDTSIIRDLQQHSTKALTSLPKAEAATPSPASEPHLMR